jgi:hypothetical protein
LPIRFKACIPSVTSRPASVFVKFDMSVSITPGATAFTRMPWGPSMAASRPLKGDTPTIELVLGYKKSNESPILKLLLSRLDELVARLSKKAH